MHQIIIASLAGALWPGLFAEGNATKVDDEYIGQIELQAGSRKYSLT